MIQNQLFSEAISCILNITDDFYRRVKSRVTMCGRDALLKA